MSQNFGLLDKSSIRTSSFSVPSYAQLANTSAIKGSFGSHFYCNPLDCPGAQLLASCDMGTPLLTPDACICLTDSGIKCPVMSESKGTQISVDINSTDKFPAINVQKGGGSGSTSLPPAPGGVKAPICPNGINFFQPANYPGDLVTYLKDINTSPTLTCEYDPYAVPNDDQIDQIVKNIDQQDNIYFLKNYCFTQETNDCIYPGSTSCPKALTNSGYNNCQTLYNKYPDLWDIGSREYCTKIHDNNKSETDFSRTGCQCVIDTQTNPSPILQKLLPKLQSSPHCFWGPCLPSQNHLNVYKGDMNTACVPPTCLNIIDITGENVFNDSTFAQDIQCTGEKKPPSPGPSPGPSFLSKYKIWIIVIIFLVILFAVGGGVLTYFLRKKGTSVE